jgi:hypothetical protein
LYQLTTKRRGVDPADIYQIDCKEFYAFHGRRPEKKILTRQNAFCRLELPIVVMYNQTTSTINIQIKFIEYNQFHVELHEQLEEEFAVYESPVTSIKFYTSYLHVICSIVLTTNSLNLCDTTKIIVDLHNQNHFYSTMNIITVEFHIEL